MVFRHAMFEHDGWRVWRPAPGTISSGRGARSLPPEFGDQLSDRAMTSSSLFLVEPIVLI